MNIAHIEENSFIYGPGCRFVIWTQGCSIHCKGCWNKEMWSFDIKNEISVSKLFENILKEKKNIEGATILGGEPFDQYGELLELVKLIKQTDLSCIVYTGYTMKELEKKRQTEILSFIDIIITGRYIESMKNIETGGLIGSTNQKIKFLTNRYSKKDLPKNNEIEISISENGQINMYGYPYNID